MTGRAQARAATRAVACLGWMLFWLPIQALALKLGWRLSWLVPRIYHRGNCAIMGFRIECHGAPAASKPVLFVANHSSYLDIVVLASLLEASFIAKREVADWPLFGLLAKLNRSVFVDRRPSKSQAHRDEMQRRLDIGDSLILFPEGTSNDGTHVLRFSSSLFSVAERTVNGAALTVQPVSIAYTDLNGLPMGRGIRPLYAWYGDMELLGHFWNVLGQGVARIHVAFHPAVTIAEFGSRKALATHCREVVAEGVSRLLHGRPAIAEVRTGGGA